MTLTPSATPDVLPLKLPSGLSLTPEQFELVCAENREAVLELAADGRVIAMTPTGSETSGRNSELLFQLQQYAKASGDWKVFESSGGFRLPDGSVVSPDASLVRLDRWRALSADERRRLAPLCPTWWWNWPAPATRSHEVWMRCARRWRPISATVPASAG
jgi:Uma2 family endonuclease